MKCKGMKKEKTKNGKKIEVKCNTELDQHAIFCHVCGEPTGALSGPLAAKVNYKDVWSKFNPNKSKYYPFAIFIILTSFLLIGLGIFFSNNLAESLKIDHYIFTNLMLLVLVPFTLIPFSFKENFTEEPFTISMYFKGLKYYLKFFLLVLTNILYFLLLKILCTGYILGITVDPILHPVRFILVLYWITITFPTALLIIRKKMNPIKAVIACYKASSETRWQQFFIVFRLFVMNIIGAALAGLGLLVTIPFSYILLEKYYMSLDEYELFDK